MDIRQTAIDRTKRFEGFVPHFYLDTTGNVTIGYGAMIPTSSAAVGLALTLNGAAATDKQKKDDWTAIKAMEAGHTPDYYKKAAKLRLAETDAATVLKDKLKGAAADLLTRFADLDKYPESVQDALLDMMFNLGLTKFSKTNWPKLFTAVTAKKWKDAAAECNRPDVPANRNTEIKDLFLAAVEPKSAWISSEDIAAIDSSLSNHMSQILKLASAARDTPVLFPHGITKIHLEIKAGELELALELSGPDTGSD
jgi:GH24 family phage-related lysozyme (muramidase)